MSTLPSTRMRRVGRWIVDAKVEPRDLWVGVFWDRRDDGSHVYVCLLPMIVIHAWKPVINFADRSQA